MRAVRLVPLLSGWLLLSGCLADGEPARPPAGDQKDSVKLLLVGDVMLGRLVNDVLQHKPPAYPWGDTLPLFAKADVRVCNLECVLSDRGRPWTATPKVFHFRSDAKNVAVLAAAGIDMVSLANNHALDYGYDALVEMLAVLDRAGVRYAGAGNSSTDACRPAVKEAGGMRLGFLAFTDNEPVWEATRHRPGICYVPVSTGDQRGQGLLKLVAQSKAEVDFLLVSAHWGPNWGYQPPPEHVSFGRALVDAGADVVFGHSAHVFRAVEIYRGKPILYSAGDFVDDYAVDEVERNDQSFIFLLDIAGGRVRELSLYPTVIRNFQARLARAGAAAEIAERMRKLCAGLGTAAVWERTQGCLKISLTSPGAASNGPGAADRKRPGSPGSDRPKRESSRTPE